MEANPVEMSKKRHNQNVRKHQGIDPSWSSSLRERDFIVVNIPDVPGYYRGGLTI
jgi:hypothetical protein